MLLATPVALTFRTLGAIVSMVALPWTAPGQLNYATPYTFVTLAGNGPDRSADGTGNAARFSAPVGIAADSAGNLYVTDFWNNTLRKVTPAGEVTTLAGEAGVEGSVDGTGSTARFSHPAGVAVDSAGNIYVSDTFNHTIRKVTPAGEVTTLVGLAGNPGSSDGTGSAARFNKPGGLAVDGAGNLYVADAANHTIRKVTSAGMVTTLAGLAGNPGSVDGTGTAARFFGPAGVTLDTAGDLYVADTGNHTIRKVTAAGVVTTLAGLSQDLNGDGFPDPGYADGNGSGARFGYPYDLAADTNGNLYVADTGNHTIRTILSQTGDVTTLAGLAGNHGSSDGTGSDARFRQPFGVTVDPTGNIYVADTVNLAIRKVTQAGVVTTLVGSPSLGSADGIGSDARFNWPSYEALDSTGNVYVTDKFNHTIRKITPTGVVTTLAGLAGVEGSTNGTGSAARFRRPAGLAADSADNLYVVDESHTVRKVTPTGEVTTLAGLADVPGSADGTGSDAWFKYPWGVAVDSASNVYVGDGGNKTIRKVTPDGVVTTLAGLPGFPGSADGTGSDARFNTTAGMAVDSAGNLYVADCYNHTIRKVTPAGEVTTLAGLAGNPGSKDGTGNTARFTLPWDVAVDNTGNLYVTESGDTIRKVTPAGVVTTLAGDVAPLTDQFGGRLHGYADGTGSAAWFYNPTGVALDSAGNLYVADALNNVIRKGVPANSVPAPGLGPPGFSAGQFRFDITGLPGLAVDLESSSDLFNWQKVGVCFLEGGTTTVINPIQNQGAHFYRAHVR